MKNKMIPALVIIAVILISAVFRSRITFGLNLSTLLYFGILSLLGMLLLRSSYGKARKQVWAYIGVYILFCAVFAIAMAV